MFQTEAARVLAVLAVGCHRSVMPSLRELKARFAAHPDVWPGERLRVTVEVGFIRLARGFGSIATCVAGLMIAHEIGKEDWFSAKTTAAIGVALAGVFTLSWFFIGNEIEKWRVARAIRVADRKRDVEIDGINVGGASVAVPSMPDAPREPPAPTLLLQGTPLLEGLYAPHEVPEEEPVER